MKTIAEQLYKNAEIFLNREEICYRAEMQATELKYTNLFAYFEFPDNSNITIFASGCIIFQMQKSETKVVNRLAKPGMES